MLPAVLRGTTGGTTTRVSGNDGAVRGRQPAFASFGRSASASAAPRSHTAPLALTSPTHGSAEQLDEGPEHLARVVVPWEQALALYATLGQMIAHFEEGIGKIRTWDDRPPPIDAGSNGDLNPN